MMIIQNKYPERNIFYAGESVIFRLSGGTGIREAYLRTNLGHASVMRREIICHAETGAPREDLAWHDLAMTRTPDGFELTLPLLEVGVFEGKCWCRTPEGMRWAEGGNFFLKVESAENAASSPIYCAFVRQFGGEKPAVDPEKLAELDRLGYTVIPPSGTFRDVKRQLDRIFNTLQCRILQLLPIHPVPTVYGRMGRYGSPFASLDYFAVDPALAEFDPKATPMEQFLELVDAVHARNGRIFLDIPVNHTGWASRLQSEHPEYFVRGEDGTFESPGAWGVVWADLCKLDYGKAEVWKLMADVFLHWCRRGVDGFRCDAGYMLPLEAWEYITAKVRTEYPDTVFMLEGLGGRISVQEDLLTKAGLDWAYSELFQNYDRDAVSYYFPQMDKCSREKGVLVNFAETHDNLRLAATSPQYAAMRCALCALLSENGAFGFANGVEYLAAEKIDVHGAGSLNERSGGGLSPLLSRLNRLLAAHPAFAPGAAVRNVTAGGGNGVAFLRQGEAGGSVLVLVNLDCQTPLCLHWENGFFPAGGRAEDLLTGTAVLTGCDGSGGFAVLEPGGFLCLSAEPFPLPEPGEPERVLSCRAELAARRILTAFGKECAGGAGNALLADPWRFMTDLSGGKLPPVTEYVPERDVKRLVPLPPGEWLLMVSKDPFRAELHRAGKTLRSERSLTAADGRNFILFAPVETAGETETTAELHFVRFPEDGVPVRCSGNLLCLLPGNDVRFRMRYTGSEVQERQIAAFGVNRHGGYTMMRAAFGKVFSKYDAVLAVNGPAPYPVDRKVLLTRLRAWLSVDGFSYDIDGNVLESFTAGQNRADWVFRIPCGQGRTTRLLMALQVSPEGEGVALSFTRSHGEEAEAPVVKVILRPDVECRPNHGVTRAYTGPEHQFPAAVRALPDGFDFAPEPDSPLYFRVDSGRFVRQEEWQYMVPLEMESRYGLDSSTDLFSPGYAEFDLPCGETAVLRAWSGRTAPEEFPAGTVPLAPELEPLQAAEAALQAYPVDRDGLKTVIAGYPWFLDWGRDTLIALRGIIAAGLQDAASDILCQFASFEENGTIPNIIHGSEVGNRDTSDAPLWLGQAAADYVRKFDDRLLKRDCRGRSFAKVLESIACHYRAGTPNGIRVDAATQLVFSPPHFTWMDTNYPAGTPREGYPIEIQAMWTALLEMTGDHAGAEKVRRSLDRYFYLPELDRFSDCLHGKGAAAEAVPDDHIRPNQLLAVTLGAVTAPDRKRVIVRSAAELLTPGSIRSLADRETAYHLPIRLNGHLLNDPAHPYQGYYQGPEDTCRKAAYHNGTAWGWLFPSYCEAMVMAGGDVRRALALLYSASYRSDRGIPGQLPEVADGNTPHREQGCAAQAWSVTEFFRVAKLLTGAE